VFICISALLDLRASTLVEISPLVSNIEKT
jgi:hypothetical protein